MRSLKSHIVEGDSSNHQIEIDILDAPGQGNAHHEYRICHNHEALGRISFQNGPIKEFGVNGITQESLLAIIIDRLECFQNGPFKSEYNQTALDHCKAALNSLQQRTRERISRGVEGQHKI